MTKYKCLKSSYGNSKDQLAVPQFLWKKLYDTMIYQPEGDVVISISKCNYSRRIWLWHREEMLEYVGSPFTSPCNNRNCQTMRLRQGRFLYIERRCQMYGFNLVHSTQILSCNLYQADNDRTHKMKST
jgi:hypothetical protein